MQLARVRPTRVYRFYRGGALIDRLRGEPERDTEYPEDWIGSVVAANNPGRDDPFAGDGFVVPAAMGGFDVRGDLRVLRCTGGTA
jgi:hypothetical protein